MELLHSGKVRDVYADGSDLLLVASDRLSVYDVVLPTPVPDKGRVLTQLSLWWFSQLSTVPNHVISALDVPDEFYGRAVRCRRLEMLPVECIARGYLSGSGLKEYEKLGSVSGVPLPPGLVEGSKLPEPIFTPTSKAPAGSHDESITYDDVVALLGSDVARRLRELTLGVYAEGYAVAIEKGIIVADTKLEFGRVGGAGDLILADEVLTPDSSRFWPADAWEPGRPQFAFDKQYVRDWSLSTGWDKRPPAPEVPAEVIAVTRERYFDAFRRITGSALQP